MPASALQNKVCSFGFALRHQEPGATAVNRSKNGPKYLGSNTRAAFLVGLRSGGGSGIEDALCEQVSDIMNGRWSTRHDIIPKG